MPPRDHLAERRAWLGALLLPCAFTFLHTPKREELTHAREMLKMHNCEALWSVSAQLRSTGASLVKDPQQTLELIGKQTKRQGRG
jgi:hypothetical protein